MARITIEDCLQVINNRFLLIHMAANRVRQLTKGASPMLTTKNREVVTALREIAAGKVVLAAKREKPSLTEPLVGGEVHAPTDTLQGEAAEPPQRASNP